MLRLFRSGLILVLALAAVAATMYPRYADIVSQAIRSAHCADAFACSRVTGVELQPAPSLAGFLIHHPASAPTR